MFPFTVTVTLKDQFKANSIRWKGTLTVTFTTVQTDFSFIGVGADGLCNLYFSISLLYLQWWLKKTKSNLIQYYYPEEMKKEHGTKVKRTLKQKYKPIYFQSSTLSV